jgi:hypothetical protein
MVGGMLSPAGVPSVLPLPLHATNHSVTQIDHQRPRLPTGTEVISELGQAVKMKFCGFIRTDCAAAVAARR